MRGYGIEATRSGSRVRNEHTHIVLGYLLEGINASRRNCRVTIYVTVIQDITLIIWDITLVKLFAQSVKSFPCERLLDVSQDIHPHVKEEFNSNKPRAFVPTSQSSSNIENC